MLTRDDVAAFAAGTYAAVIEHPWERWPLFATFKHPANKKWFGVIMTVSPDKLGLQGDAHVDILNVKTDPALVRSLIQDDGYHRAYHMNKDHWITIRLDGTVADDQIFGLLDMSYVLAGPKAHTTSDAVHKSMQGNKSSDTKPEMLVRAMLRDMGFRGYRLQWKKCPGRPDIAFPGKKLAIYVNGCFWHRCPRCKLAQPKSNEQYWAAKFERNVERDKRNLAAAAEQGWKTLVVWECDLKKDRVEKTRDVIYKFVKLEGESDED